MIDLENLVDTRFVFLDPLPDFNPKFEVAACFLSVGDDFLFLKRQPHKHEGSRWGIPGGKRDEGETIEETVIREILEETGLSLHEHSFDYFGQVYIRYPEVDFTYHMFGYVLDEYPQHINIATEQHTEYRWVTLQEALTMDLIRGEHECIYLAYPDTWKVTPTE